MSKRPYLWAALVAAAALLVLGACGSDSSTSGASSGSTTAASGEPIIVGVPISVTGFSAADGKLAQQGIEYAVNELNAAGGVLGRQLQIEVFDTQDLAPERLLLAADTLVGEKKADVVVTCWSGNGADIQAFGKYPVPFFCVDGSAQTNETIAKGGYWNCFQLIDGEPPQGAYMFTFMNGLPYDYPNNKVITVGSDDAYGRSMTDSFAAQATASGWEVVAHEYVPYGTSDWGPVLSKVRSMKPSILYMEVDSTPDMITLLRQFRQDPTNTLLMFGFGMQLQDFISTAGADADGVLGMTPGMGYPVPPSTPEGNDWVQAFADAEGNPPAGAAVNDYAAVKMWAQAAEAAGDPTKYDEIVKYLQSTTFDAVPGWVPLKFNEGNYIPISTLPLALGQLQSGQLVTLYYKGQPYTDWQGNEMTFQVPSWIK